jgi:predicted nucleic acid-binding protein
VITVEPLIVVADTSVLINFLKLNRMDLIGRHSSKFLVTNHVADEVSRHYTSQRARFQAALDSEILEEHSVTDPQDFALFGELCRGLGAGEASAIAFAAHRGYALAIDDNKAIRVAGRISESFKVFRTQDLILSMIRENLIDIVEANALKHELETQHRFKMPISDFGELL